MDYRKRHIVPKIRRLLPRKHLLQRPFFWVSLLAAAAGGIIAYGILFSPMFRIETIEVIGNQKIKHDDIESVVVRESRNRILLTRQHALSKKILDEFPVIASVSVEKDFPHKVTLKVRERQLAAVLCQANNACFSVDADGVAFESLEQVPPAVIMMEMEAGGKEVFVGEEAVNKQVMDIIMAVQRNLSRDFQIDIKSAFVSSPLILRTSEQWKIYFDPSLDASLQIAKLDLLLKNGIGAEDRKKLEYIYLQYKDRAYYK